MTKEEIADKLYASYGTDSGILFGITERLIIETIIDLSITYKDQELREYAEEIKAFEKRMGLDEDEYDSIAEHFMDISDCLKSREQGYNQVIQDLKQEVNELQKEVQRLKDLKA